MPYVVVNGAKAYMKFIVDVLGGTQLECHDVADGKVQHAQMRIGDSVIMLSDGSEKWPASPVGLYVYVDSCDETHKKALAAGAKELMPPMDQPYNDRMSGVTDPTGNTWWIAQHLG